MRRGTKVWFYDQNAKRRSYRTTSEPKAAQGVVSGKRDHFLLVTQSRETKKGIEDFFLEKLPFELFLTKEELIDAVAGGVPAWIPHKESWSIEQVLYDLQTCQFRHVQTKEYLQSYPYRRRSAFSSAEEAATFLKEEAQRELGELFNFEKQYEDRRKRAKAKEAQYNRILKRIESRIKGTGRSNNFDPDL